MSFAFNGKFMLYKSMVFSSTWLNWLLFSITGITVLKNINVFLFCRKKCRNKFLIRFSLFVINIIIEMIVFNNQQVDSNYSVIHKFTSEVSGNLCYHFRCNLSLYWHGSTRKAPNKNFFPLLWKYYSIIKVFSNKKYHLKVCSSDTCHFNKSFQHASIQFHSL